MTAPSQTDVRDACQRLAGLDPVLNTAYQRTGVPAWRSVPATYATLARAVTFQLISIAAAEAIWQRMIARFGHEITPEDVLAASDADLRACGQSGPKVAHLKSIADACVSEQLDFERLARLDSASASAELRAVKGIGPWTANLFVLTAMGRFDVFPTGDVGIMEAHRRISGDEKRHNSRSFAPIVRNWTPVQGVAAHLLWAWLHLDRAG
ncbi:MAG: DNA-3-methyladenine glycosylase 2 family protein [Henriciella sp.]|nr:DNA-3-methyladenine glycosylase 2 family protein [Henriciella sp.]